MSSNESVIAAASATLAQFKNKIAVKNLLAYQRHQVKEHSTRKILFNSVEYTLKGLDLAI